MNEDGTAQEVVNHVGRHELLPQIDSSTFTNNPDIVSEVRFITNQFLAEFGRTAGSVMSIVTRSGVNSPHGSLFWFHNDNHLNALSNTDKLTRPTPTGALFRIENQFGGTFGGRTPGPTRTRWPGSPPAPAGTPWRRNCSKPSGGG